LKNQTRTDDDHAYIIFRIMAGEFPNGVFSAPTFVGRGAVSSVYGVEVNGKPLAIKLHSADRESISEYEREYNCLVQAKAAGLPVPEVCAVGWDEYKAGLIAHGLPEETAGMFSGLFRASRQREFACVDPTLPASSDDRRRLPGLPEGGDPTDRITRAEDLIRHVAQGTNLVP
jgi:hypothetical protein